MSLCGWILELLFGTNFVQSDEMRLWVIYCMVEFDFWCELVLIVCVRSMDVLAWECSDFGKGE